MKKLKKSHRMERINTLIKRTLGEIILEEMGGNFITVMGVDTKADLSSAVIIISALGNEKEIVEQLNTQSGHFRANLGKKVRLKKTPKLIFKQDLSKSLYEKLNKI